MSASRSAESQSSPGLSRRALIVLVLTAALCGCGKKGGLELPPPAAESESGDEAE